MLVVAKGYEPTFAAKVDPFAGPLEVSLEKFNRPNLGPRQRVQGRVINPEGRPVLGAKLEPHGITRGDRTSFGGRLNMDPLAVTDENGEFLLTATEPFDAVTLSIEARGLAPTNVAGLNGQKGWLIKLNEGANVTGRLIRNDQPMPGIAISLAGQNRRSGEFAGYFDATTGKDGRFHFFNVPTVGGFTLCAKMESAGTHGVTPTKVINVNEDGGTVTADLELKPGLRLSGMVVLADGKPLPPNSKLSISRQEAWDGHSIALESDGRFELKNLPAESLSLGLRVPGYRLSAKNPSLDRLNGFSVMGRLEKDTDSFIILLEPGKPFRAEDFPGFDGDMQPRDKPLRSAPAPAPNAL